MRDDLVKFLSALPAVIAERDKPVIPEHLGETLHILPRNILGEAVSDADNAAKTGNGANQQMSVEKK